MHNTVFYYKIVNKVVESGSKWWKVVEIKAHFPGYWTWTVADTLWQVID
ncbi:MAG: hypothetical protein NC407_08935 [Lachnoclostridium sp.]|nr:hypothetical protein [Lachnoclostridium sp.]